MKVRALCLMLTGGSIGALSGCSQTTIDDSAYVMIRNSTMRSDQVAVRSYFWGEGAELNGISCREVAQLANEAVELRRSRGERHLEKYECVSLSEARARGVR